MLLALPIVLCNFACAQDADQAAIERGSKTAKGGFQNEDEIRDKFNNWKSDPDAQAWLSAMGHKTGDVQSLKAVKPTGSVKADVEVTIESKLGVNVERISIKLVSSSNGFNQIDKRWLSSYAEMWDMPKDVIEALKLFVGETPPTPGSRDDRRMYINELPAETQAAVLNFFAAHKDEIVSDLLGGDGAHAAGWFMVTFKATEKPKWLIRPTKDAVRFFSEGEVVLTRAGNIKLGRIGVQRKGGDNGRDTAKMLQFKINPVQLFDMK